jgi:heptosyltransferase-2
MNIKLLRFLDKYIIGFFILCLFWLKYFFVCQKKYIIKHPKKILIIRLRALWSSLLTFPMIKQLQDHYCKEVQYDLLASSRNIWVFKNQWYFGKIFNIFSFKDILKLFLSFKKYDIVIDAEEYFMVSSLFSIRTGKINIWYNNIKVRWLAYNSAIKYNDQQHSIITTLDLIKKIWIDYKIPEYMEPLKFIDKDKVKVDEFLSKYIWTFICMHTWWAETAKERSWPQKKWIKLIILLCEKYPNMYIFLSGTNLEKNIVQNILHELPQKCHSHVINICWKFNLFEFAYLLQKCNLMISNDTWPMHLSAAMRTKTIWLFGPELPSKFGPWPLSKNIWLYKWDGISCIKVHLGIWEKDIHYWVDKIDINDIILVL